MRQGLFIQKDILMSEKSNPTRPAELFNEYQLRRVRIVLARFEEDLRMALDWLEGEHVEGYLYRRKLVLTPELQDQARQSILKGLEEIRRLAEMLDFEPKVENASRELMGRLNIDWESLSDIHARSLRVYGAVDPRLNDILDGSADRMSQISLELGNIFMQGPVE